MDPVTIITSVISIVGAIAGTYEAISKIADLPKAFDEVKKDLPLVQSILENAQERLTDPDLHTTEHSQAILAIIEPCKDKAEELKKIFDKIETECKGDRGAKDWTRVRDVYRKTLRGIKSHRVEVLMNEILKGLKRLALSQLFQSAMQKDLKAVEKAIEELSNVEPSVADSELDPPGSIQASQAIAAGATGSQTNVSGSNNTVNNGEYAISGSGHTFHFSNQDLDQKQRQKEKWLQKLYTCPYRDQKDRNPPRVEGTCEWFTNHSLFQNWRQSNTAHLLWVSADPGCGKSVLARYLADQVLPSTTTRTTCYFFFKEDFEDQRSSVTALCSILHQVFSHYPASFSSQILNKFQNKGATLLTSFGDLWDILISATTSHQREIVCVFDALDECEVMGRHQLIDAISKFSSHTTTGSPPLKFLLTSRPYVDIKRRFQDLGYELPTIHLRGENDKEIAKISSEIDMVIGRRVIEISRTLELGPKEQNILIEELTRVPNRTYLWVHLIFSELQNSILLTQRQIRSEIRNIPRTVSDAYDKILSKSQNPGLTRKLLHIIVAAIRPLTLQEMALALTIGPEHRSISDLDLVPEEKFRDNIRQLCGLFVAIVDSKVYLLHQTAREYLVLSSGSSPPPTGSMVSQWKFSLYPQESHRILAEICIQRLSLSDFDLNSLRASTDQNQYITMRTFLQYAAQFWADHFREVSWNGKDWAVSKAKAYCRPDLPTPAWFEIYRRVTTKDMPGNFTPLLVTSYFGLISVVEQFPRKVLKDVNVKDSRFGRSAISWAAGGGHVAVLQRLLEAGAQVDAKDNDGSTPLHLASRNGYDTIVQQLLKAGAQVDAKRKFGGSTPLHLASRHGHDTIVQQLLKAGAQVDVKDNDDGSTPLHWASQHGHNTIVQQLLKAGAQVDVKDNDDGSTPLHWASKNGHDTIVQQLRKAGAQVDAKRDDDGSTPLHLASRNGHDTIVQQLLKAGAQVDAKEKFGGSMPLHWASRNGHDTIVQQLLKAGAQVDAKREFGGSTPLHLASWNGHDTIVQQLLKAGAQVDAKEKFRGSTPLHWASEYGHDMIVQQLLKAGAQVDVKRKFGGSTPLHWASRNGHDTIVQQLLKAGAQVDVKRDDDGSTPLHWASRHGYDTIVQQLLKAGAQVDVKRDDDGSTPLHWASRHGYDTIVQQLLKAGAQVDAKRDDDGSTPLHLASRHGYDTIVQQLLKAGAQVDVKRDDDGSTPLHWASRHGYDTIVQQLLKAGAQVDAKRDDDRSTPLHLASRHGHDTIVQQLLKAGAQVDAKREFGGSTPLHLASRHGYDMIVQQLLKAGAQVDAKEKFGGSTLLHWASQHGHDTIVQQLLKAGAQVDAKEENFSSTPMI
ncbi:hypothetical protein jhhlp_003145 [Lomentospora prolificans]|uniref:Uncharacterized protein n=1 Tax=Lomentospora prolificans TaxID=41688 RepID=A0A2N3NG80_9PEZI|nr:hypothetical protein jhhlp_003145 [Lomentospora prolificans]